MTHSSHNTKTHKRRRTRKRSTLVSILLLLIQLAGSLILLSNQPAIRDLLKLFLHFQRVSA